VDATVVLECLSALGVTITPRPNGNLWLEPASKIPPALLELVRQHKVEVIAYLERHDSRDDMAEPWILQEWRRVSIPQWRDILQQSLVRGGKKRESYARWWMWSTTMHHKTCPSVAFRWLGDLWDAPGPKAIF